MIQVYLLQLVFMMRGPGQLSRYSDSLRAGRSRDRFLLGGEIFRNWALMACSRVNFSIWWTKSYIWFCLTSYIKRFQVNHFVLNADKTNSVQFITHQVCYYPLNLTYVDQILVKTDTVKFLGLQLYSHLTWKTHINYLSWVLYVS